MKKLILQSTEINIRTELEELTYSEVILFQQHIAKILYNIDNQDFAQLMVEVRRLFNNQQYAEMIVLLENYYTGLQVQEYGKDSWVVCFGILIEKHKPELNEFKLVEAVRELERQGLKAKQIKEEVENFSKAFPLTNTILRLRVEGLKEIFHE